jgi:HK97 gp10 family phage protein
MARMIFMASEDFVIRLAKFETQFEATAKKAIQAGADIIADKIKSNLIGVLSEEATGELVASFGITPIKKDREGNWNAKVGFDGYDSKGVANQLKARVLESGSTKQRKRPFVRPAVNSTRKKVVEKMNQVIEAEIKKISK